ncbi:hypothetical protein CSOJ01_12172 [Colletotrichum sojae]|uniref:Uncharacterized protein n=1 Tax=Colletotrichum sojae TaxID=2175907 RepID=A0A8H6MMQ2_9PEZI|nr:hypothetical protein CSOJ01_12172 [Colletotrichum sojae]
MKFSAVVISVFAAVAFAAPAPRAVEDVSPRDTDKLAVRQLPWTCNCINGRRVCCGGPNGACSYGSC